MFTQVRSIHFNKIPYINKKALPVQNKITGNSTLQLMRKFSTSLDHDTPLHSVIRHAKHPDEIYQLIKKYPVDSITKMARTTNDQGDLPLDLLDQADFSKKELLELELFFTRMMKKQDIKPMSELLCADDILKSYYPPLDEEYRENIKLGCYAANQVRQIIKYSSTHPDLNYFNQEKQIEIGERISHMRDVCTNNQPNYIASLCKAYESGNCFEYSFAAIKYINQQAKRPLQANVVKIKKDDHVFVIFGRPSFPHTDQYLNKEAHLTYCDAWSGKVNKLDLENLQKDIGTYKSYYSPIQNLRLNVIATYNPAYHSLANLKSFYIQGVAHKNAMAGLGLFDAAHKYHNDSIIPVHHDTMRRKGIVCM